MMKSLKVLISILVCVFSATVIANPGMVAPAGKGLETGTVTETIDVPSYVYLKLKEQDIWIAAPAQKISAGETINFHRGMEMRNFYSKTLDRTFASIFFSSNVRSENPNADAARADTTVKKYGTKNPGLDSEKIKDIHRAMAAKDIGTEKVAIPKPVAVELPKPGEIKPLDDGKTIADIVAESTDLKDQSVSLRAKVIKVSTQVMGKNWITLQDGTGTKPNDKLLATSAEIVSPGDLVIAKGIIRSDVDLGSGYNYKVLLEEATFSQSKN